MLRLLFPLIFIAVPLAEIALFVMIGGHIGVFVTIGLVILTAIVGTTLLRLQGFAVLRQLRQSLDHGQMPIDAVIDGAFLLVAGLLLLTPGFLTDSIGFMLFIPVTRRSIAHWIARALRNHVTIHTGPAAPPERGNTGPKQKGKIIDGEVIASDDDQKPG